MNALSSKEAATRIRKAINAVVGKTEKISVRADAKCGSVCVQIQATSFTYFKDSYAVAFDRFTEKGQALNDVIACAISSVHQDKTRLSDSQIDFLNQNFAVQFVDPRGSLIF